MVCLFLLWYIWLTDYICAILMMQLTLGLVAVATSSEQAIA